MSDFGPENEGEEEAFAVEAFRVDVQHRIQTVMNQAQVSQKELANRLGVSESRVSQIFSSKSNMTVRFLARVFHALRDECRLESRLLDQYRVEKARSRLELYDCTQDDIWKQAKTIHVAASVHAGARVSGSVVLPAKHHFQNAARMEWPTLSKQREDVESTTPRAVMGVV